MDNNNNNKVIVTIMLYLLSVSLMAQTGFMKSYHIAETGTDNADVIMADTSGYLLQIRTDCNISPTCAGLVKVNLEGIKQWDNLFANPSYLFNPNPTTIKMTDTSYVLSGGLGYFGNAWQVFFLQVNSNGDSLRLKEYGDIVQEERGSPMVVCNDTLIGLISYSDISSYAHLKLLKMCLDFSNLTEIPLLGVNGYAFNYGHSLTFSSDSTFLYLNIKNRNNTPQNYMAVRKIDLMGNTVWTYPLSGYTTATSTPTQITILDNGNIVTHWFDEEFGSFEEVNPYLICLNSESEFVWRYNFNDNAYKKTIRAVTKAANGDIIGCGFTHNPNYNYDVGWLFRVSPAGQLLWEREYVSYTPTANILDLQGIDEDANGNIVVTGLIVDALPTGGYEGNALLLKVLPNGCFTPNCNGGAEDTLIVASTVVGIEEASPQPPPKEGGLVVFPNPANNFVQVLLPNTTKNATLQITDLQGRVVKTITPSFGGGKGEASTHDLPNGMYLVSYTVAGKQAITAKLIIVH